MLQTIGFPAGGRQIDAKATYFRYESANSAGSDETIRVRADGNDLGTYTPGDSIELPVSANRWEIIPASNTNTGTVRLGIGRVASARVAGTVRVVDGEREKVLAGYCFRAPCTQGAAGVSAMIVQVWNPLGSGKNLFIQTARVALSVADSWGFQTCEAQMPTALAIGRNLNKLGQASVALTRSDTTGAARTNEIKFGDGFLAANADALVEFRRPVLVPPGTGFGIFTNTPATTIRSAIEWEEWPQ